MRENRPYGSEGGEAKAFPTPIRGTAAAPTIPWIASSPLATLGVLAMTDEEPGP